MAFFTKKDCFLPPPSLACVFFPPAAGFFAEVFAEVLAGVLAVVFFAGAALPFYVFFLGAAFLGAAFLDVVFFAAGFFVVERCVF